jgi:hypothetical protein
MLILYLVNLFSQIASLSMVQAKFTAVGCSNTFPQQVVRNLAGYQQLYGSAIMASNFQSPQARKHGVTQRCGESSPMLERSLLLRQPDLSRTIHGTYSSKASPPS